MTITSQAITSQVRHDDEEKEPYTHKLRPPRPDHPVAHVSTERIQRRPVLGGLINEYERAA